MAENNSINAPLPVAIVNGGTGADNAPDARDNLGITIGARTIIGTPDEVNVLNGDGSGGDPTVSLDQNIIMPGTGAATVPRGPTSVRPGSPVTGQIRLNTDTQRLEHYSAGAWEGIVFPWNHLTGFIHEAIPAQTVSFGPGQCVDSTNFFPMTNPANFTKTTAFGWFPGSGSGGFPSSLVIANNTTYYTFAVSKEDGTTDFGFDSDPTGVNLLAQTSASPFFYIYIRRIGSVRTSVGSTNLEAIFNVDDYFYYFDPRQDFTIAYGGVGTVNSIVPLSIPDAIPVMSHVMGTTLRESADANPSRVYLMSVKSLGVANNYSSHSFDSEISGGDDISEGSSFYLIPSEDGTIRMFSDIFGAAAGGDSFVSTIGWTDRRGR